MAFCILDSEHQQDVQKWLRLWTNWGGREVFAHPSYVKLFCRRLDKALCAVYESERGIILFPFILRPLGLEPWAVTADGLSDVITPYGYGGAYIACGNAGDHSCFWQEFEGWAKENGVVSLFARLSLFHEQVVLFDGELWNPGDNIVVSLNRALDDIWRGYAHKVRKNVNKALRNGLTVIVDETGRYLDHFLELYYKTMDRNSAQEGYYFPEEFFRELMAVEGNYSFFHVTDGRQILSTELVLLSAQRAYSFLGGTVKEAFLLRPNDLLKHEIITWAKNKGLKQFVLGGGYTPNDGIYQYKKGFAPDGVMPFSVGSDIFIPRSYQELLDSRRTYERERGRVLKAEGFFPEYRAPAE